MVIFQNFYLIAFADMDGQSPAHQYLGEQSRLLLPVFAIYLGCVGRGSVLVLWEGIAGLHGMKNLAVWKTARPVLGLASLTISTYWSAR
jgi:hypothetical protein